MASASVSHKLQDATVEVERLGERFLINRQAQVDTDRARNGVREALTALRKQHADRKTWIQLSSSTTFQRCSTIAAIDRLEREAAQLEARMEALRREQKQMLGLLGDKGVTPQGLEDGMLRALLQLKD